ncbi:MAG TPA: FAD-dependent oxidoreductase [Vicinamibacterales bacterium]|nr:FAD-dependent oxidoreductase [Vicinamibacterales bacterium]
MGSQLPSTDPHRDAGAPSAPQTARTRKPVSFSTRGAWQARISSHEAFNHDSIDHLGYDWGRVGDPHAAPRRPLKVYIPETAEEVVRCVKEAKALGEQIVVRSKGHSSNGLVLTDRGTVLLTDHMNKILEIDESGMTATAQSGLASADLDDVLADRGLGVPIIGDHNHITLGGFASVGGISPASHRFGMFIDTVERLQYVDWDGNLGWCSRTEHPEQFHRLLAGLGRYGVITALTVRMIRIDKYTTILRNDQTHYRSLDGFLKGSSKYIHDPGEALYERGVFAEFRKGNGSTASVGQFSAYVPTSQSTYARGRNSLAYGYLHGIGYVAGRLPRRLDRILKYIGIAGVLWSPSYASIKNVEFFTDKILDSTVGDPTRMFIVLAPLAEYEVLFRESFELMREFRDKYHCMTFVSVYVKSIKSPYLAQGRPDQRFCELMYYCGIRPEGMTNEVLERLAEGFDDITIRHGGFRYMHSRTSRDPERWDKVNPNTFYSRAAVPGAG